MSPRRPNSEQVAKRDWVTNYADELTGSYKYYAKTIDVITGSTHVKNLKASNLDLTLESYTPNKFQVGI